MGGVEARQMTGDVWSISARGNAYTSTETIVDYVLLKAAETTIAAGGTHFIVLDVQDSTRVGTGYTPVTANTTGYGNYATTTFYGGNAYPIVRPGQSLLIRVLSSPAAGAFDAAEIIAIIGARVRT